jgi:PEP-CTERM motif
VTGAFLGTITDGTGAPIINSGLWSLRFGNGGNGGDPNTLYFSAGINGEADGLFGAIAPVPEPGTLGLLGIDVLSLYGLRRRRARRAANGG